MGKKPLLVTADELEEVRHSFDALRAEFDKSKVEGPLQTRDQITKVSKEIEELVSQRQKASDSNIEDLRRLISAASSDFEAFQLRADESYLNLKALEARTQELQGSVAALPAVVESRAAELRVQLAAATSDMAARAERHANHASAAVAAEARTSLEYTRSTIQDKLYKVEEMCEATARQCEVSIQAFSARLDNKLDQMVQAQRGALDDLAKALRSESYALERILQETTEKELARLEVAHNSSDSARGKQIQQLEGEVRTCFEKLSHHDEKIALGVETTHKFRRNAEGQLSDKHAEQVQHVRRLDEDVARLQALCGEVSGLATRQIEWDLDDVLHKLRLFKDGQDPNNGSWFSPKFDAAGVRGLQLEIRLLQSLDGSSDEEKKASVGDCSVFLWAAEGLRLSFRLSLGGESAELKHVFNGKTPCGVVRMCCLAEQVNKQDGSLRVGVEIHEASRDHQVSSTTTAPAACHLLASGHSEAGTTCDSSSSPSSSGTLRLQTYLNHRLMELIQRQSRGLLELVQRKVDLVRSRSVRRVQWRLEGASMLRQCFAEGKAVCSTAFQAAGVSGMQLVFYPSGCAGAREGFCSFFLSCPAGCALRCWLWAGRWRKEARPEPDDRQDLLGRVNFCRFENCVDPVDESVELAIEIEEAQQITKDGFHTPLGSTLLSHPPSGTTDVGVVTLSRKTQDLDRMDISTLKLELKPSSKVNPGQVKQLPAIWTSHGFHTFGEFRDVRPTNGTTSSRGSGAIGTGSDGGDQQQQQQQQHERGTAMLMQSSPGSLATQPLVVVGPPRSASNSGSKSARSARNKVAGLGLGASHKYREYLSP
mmetsp:Transcript_87500/g.282690  ORF Transcript_87500/g.282690 Transcript_87500/m.282690 type:complete len:823 (-) Transcript_87500:131-2599(-)|eukprot:CAMPEP_0203881990 /NCGR_PEP_ID=MMETSP0359-20131031/26223_1 /ASSEMBLY_ACC=CAM_ASM_000338 /TAXON_ID=268821 /ORGANISM="Scrippsiella Hangoei, Strain SHTV-5" /LENGTH=822 /DNA_ID=CAMNT_0050801943 /DNA_START=58 /DNA_END=2529 /DNA_ORIENTATION=-